MLNTYFALRVVCIANCGWLGTCDLTNQFMNDSQTKERCVERGMFLIGLHGGDGKGWRIVCVPKTTSAVVEIAP